MLLHLGEAVEAPVKDAGLVDGDDLLPVVLWPADAGVVGENIYATPCVDCGLDSGLDVVLVAGIGADGAGLTAGVLDLGRYSAGGVLVDVGRHHFRALAGEDDGHRLADAGAGAGDEGALAFQSHGGMIAVSSGSE